MKEIKTTPLPTTLEEAFKYAQINERIVPWASYGEHISITCKNHPELRWHTKNIGGIGSRSIFFTNWPAEECSCSGGLLEPLIPENWEQKIVPLKIITCSCCKEPLAEEKYRNSTHCHECFESHCGYPEINGTWKNPCGADKRQ